MDMAHEHHKYCLLASNVIAMGTPIYMHLCSAGHMLYCCIHVHVYVLVKMVRYYNVCRILTDATAKGHFQVQFITYHDPSTSELSTRAQSVLIWLLGVYLACF
jgi:hypothetical protein